MSIARRAFQSPTAFAVCALLGILAAGLSVGPIGGWALALGVLGSGFNLLAMRWIILLAADAAIDPQASPKPTKMTMLIVFAFFVKLPVLIGLALYVQTLGSVALPCFLWGLGLVYFALVGWALATS